MNAEWRNRYELAVSIAQAAGRHALQYFDQPMTVETKEDRSPVTIADREAEAMMRAAILDRFPGDGILGEEFGEQPSGTGYRWIMDPIDGTKSFIRAIPLWGTLLGVEYKGEMIAGATVMPAFQGTTYHALRGAGAFRDGRPIRVSSIDRLDQAVLFYSSVSWFVAAKKEQEFLALAATTARQRGYGDFYGFMLVAQGSGEVMAEHGVSPWDVAAVKPIVEEAGGRFSDWSGTPTIQRPDVIASNGLLHEEVLRFLRGSGPGRA
jgi:histidinol-phosphatase